MIRPAQTRIFAVIGIPIKHSLSPIMMNTAFNVLGLDAVYLALEVDDPKRDLQVLLDAGFSGLSVTLPHKETVYSMVQCVDDASKNLGAVNTLKRSVDKWVGKNTDWMGIVKTFEERNILMKGKSVLVIGAGGAARSAIYAARYMGMDVTVTNRTYERALKLKDEFGCKVVGFKEVEKGDMFFDVVFQTTPVGMAGYYQGMILPSSFFKPGMVVMDFVYNPAMTEFLSEAKAKGCKIVSGLEMLLYQGVAQFEWWFDMKAPVDAMKKVLFEKVGIDEKEFF